MVQPFPDCATCQQTHDNIGNLFMRTVIINRHDVRMFQRSRCPCFTVEAFGVTRLVCQRLAQNFDRDQTLKVFLVRSSIA